MTMALRPAPPDNQAGLLILAAAMLAIVMASVLSGCMQSQPAAPPVVSAELEDDQQCARDKAATDKFRADTLAEAARVAEQEARRVVESSKPAPQRVQQRPPATRRQAGYTGAKVFMAPGCDPCEAQHGWLKWLADTTGWTVGTGPQFHWWLVRDSYAGESPEVTEAYPTTVYYRNGVEYLRHVGFDVRRARQVFDELMRAHPNYPE